MKCACYKCGKEVPTGVDNHFIDESGKIFCVKCSKQYGYTPVSERIKRMLLEIELKENQ